MEDDWTYRSDIDDEEPLCYDRDDLNGLVPKVARLVGVHVDDAEERYITQYKKFADKGKPRIYVVRSTVHSDGCELVKTVNNHQMSQGIAMGLKVGWDGISTSG